MKAHLTDEAAAQGRMALQALLVTGMLMRQLLNHQPCGFASMLRSHCSSRATRASSLAACGTQIATETCEYCW
eukprot:2491792-Amphidinium_carterae.1